MRALSAVSDDRRVKRSKNRMDTILGGNLRRAASYKQSQDEPGLGLKKTCGLQLQVPTIGPARQMQRRTLRGSIQCVREDSEVFSDGGRIKGRAPGRAARKADAARRVAYMDIGRPSVNVPAWSA